MTGSMIMEVGKFEVHTTTNGGHPAEFYADRLVNRLISVSANAPEPIKAQALLFRDSMYTLTLETIRTAMASERSTVMAEINRSI